MPFKKYIIYFQKHWLKIICLLFLITAIFWAYRGFSELYAAYEILKTPAFVVLLTPSPTVADFSLGTPVSIISGLITSTPSPTDNIPNIPSELKSILGDSLYPVLTEDQAWHLADLRGRLYYYWDGKLSKWIAHPEVKEKYCSIPVISLREDERWDSVCYLDFTGLGIENNSGVQTNVVISKDSSGNEQLSRDSEILYELDFDPQRGYQWKETSRGYNNRISIAAKLISEINPQIYNNDIQFPSHITTETYSTDKSITARFIGGINHNIIGADKKSLGVVMLYLFIRNENVHFWISGEGQVLGINFGIPILKNYTEWDIEKFDFLSSGKDLLVPGNRYEFYYFGSRYVVPNSKIGQIDLAEIDEMSLINNSLVVSEAWMTKQLLLIYHEYNMGESWLSDSNGELATSPPVIVPYYYLKIP